MHLHFKLFLTLEYENDYKEANNSEERKHIFFLANVCFKIKIASC